MQKLLNHRLKLFIVGLFTLFSSISVGAPFTSVKGEIRLYLPRQLSSAHVTFNLKEAKTQVIKPAISTLSKTLKNNQHKSFDLPYSLKDISSDKYYIVEVKVMDIENNKILSEDAFPVITFGFPKILYISINIPPTPIENQK